MGLLDTTDMDPRMMRLLVQMARYRREYRDLWIERRTKKNGNS